VNKTESHTITSLYDRLQALDVPMDHRDAELFVLDTPAVQKAIASFLEDGGTLVRVPGFESVGQRWLHLPFQYSPYWEARADLGTGISAGEPAAEPEEALSPSIGM